MAFNTDLTWIQDGEEITGGVDGSSEGLLNRLSLLLLENDLYLRSYKKTIILTFVADELTPIYSIAMLNSDGKMELADNTNIEILTSLIGIALNNIDSEAAGLYQVGDTITNSSWTLDVGKAVYVGVSGALTQTEPSGPAYSKLIGYALTATSIYLK